MRTVPAWWRSCARFAIAALILAGSAGSIITTARPDQIDAAFVKTLKEHKARDGNTVEYILTQARRYGFYLRGWVGDAKHHQAGVDFVAEPKQGKDDEITLWWNVDPERRVVEPGAIEDTRVVELGALPFLYYTNQWRKDQGKSYDRRLITDSAVLKFLPSEDGDLFVTFRKHRLVLRRLNINWLDQPPGNGSAYERGYVIWVFFDCPLPRGANPLFYRDQQIGFVEPNGVGGFRPFNRGAVVAIQGGAPCAVPPGVL